MSEALELAERALAAAAGDEAAAFVQAERSGLARFAGADIHQPTLIENAVVRLLVVRDGKIGSAATNRVTGDGLAALAARAQEIADGSSPDPSFAGLAPPAEVPVIEGYDERTAELPPEEQASLARAALAAAEGFGLYGYVTSGAAETATAATTGLRASQRTTDATVLVIAAVDGASGYADATSWKVGELEPDAVAQEAVRKASSTRGATTIEPARYRAVLEPYAVAELLEYFARDTFNALGFLEQRSYVVERIGERVFDEKISIADDALDPRGLPKAFDFEGVPKQPVQLVEDGVARGVVWDRATAARAGGGRESTGHALAPEYRQYGAIPFALVLSGGDAGSTEELAERVGDGIYVTRLHYLSVVEPREGIITGMTRDGTFRIRDGKIAEPLANLRFTVSVPHVLEDVPGLTRAQKLVNRSDFYGDRFAYGALVPALATTRFTITGVGSEPGL